MRKKMCLFFLCCILGGSRVCFCDEASTKTKSLEYVDQMEGTKVKDSNARKEADAAYIELEDGKYAIPVTLVGGSGKSTVTTPTELNIEDGIPYATLVWSSSNYDYMIVGGKVYLPVNEEGYSTFKVPITAVDRPMTVIADTTAMSTPHEVEYFLTFDASGVMSASQTPQEAAKRVVIMTCIIIGVCILASVIKKRRRP